MNFLRNNKLQKLSAAFFLALFVFINAVKTFHTHEFAFASSNSNNKNAVVVKTTFFCPICDFQIAKDIDAEIAILNISTPEYFIVSYYHFSSLQLRNFSVTSSVRGPPVFLS